MDCGNIINLIDNCKFKEAHGLILDSLSNNKSIDEDSFYNLLRLQHKCSSVDDGSYVGYNYDRVCELVDVVKNACYNSEMVTVTMTSCKRLDLFEKTVNSFLECCVDLDRYLYEWIVVDDNSSSSDRDKMCELYPFIKFIFKGHNDKGHAKSMNILVDNIKTNYVLHLEDDWRFFVRDDYIGKCLSVLRENDRYGQCLFNRLYGEDLDTYHTIGGGYMRYTCDGLRYFIHENLYGFGHGDMSSKLSKFGLYNCIYWPHYSLRVGITRKEVFDRVGYYSEVDSHFEREYACRYVDCGFLTTYLDNVVCSHIGRKTYEIGKKDVVNAYDLNLEDQFVKKNKSFDVDLSMKIYVLNLVRRPDRLLRFREMNDGELFDYNIFNAVDGSKLSPCHRIQKLFSKNDYNFRKGIVGCALSHLAMWAELYNSDLESMLILEDDAELCPDFMKKFMHLLSVCDDADIIFLGHHPYPSYVDSKNYVRDVFPVGEKWSRERCVRESMGGTTGYFITKRGVCNMFKYIESNSINNGIDWVMFKTADINNIYYCSPFLVFADCYQDGKGVDTDIQTVFDGVGYSSFELWMRDEVDYWLNFLGEVGLCGDLYDYKNVSTSRLVLIDNIDKELMLKNVCIIKSSRVYVENSIRFLPIKCYDVGDYVFCVPENLCCDIVLNDKTFSRHINLYNIMGDLCKYS